MVTKYLASALFFFNITKAAALSSTLSPVNAYVHLPFCRRRCFYCDFPVVVTGNSPRQATIDAYLECLKREIEATASSGDGESLGSLVRDSGGLQSLYFGGGTPSLLDPEFLGELVASVSDRFGGLAEDCEVTLEMDPGTFDASRLEAYMSLACVNRVSLGVQSWSAEALEAAGRAHTVDDANEAVAIVKNMCGRDDRRPGGGLRSWSLDLISGLPNDSVESWAATLEKTIHEVKPPHVSVYDLQVEEGTAFGKWFSPGVFPLPSEDSAAAFYRMASSKLRESGYEHYEISSYALRHDSTSDVHGREASMTVLSRAPKTRFAPSALRCDEAELISGDPIQSAPGTRREGEGEVGAQSHSTTAPGPADLSSDLGVLASPPGEPSPYRSRHNSCYWAMRPFLGFGLGASSMLRATGGEFARAARVSRPRDSGAYSRWVDALHAAGPSERAGILRGRQSHEEEGHKGDPPNDGGGDDDDDALLESVMTALRTADGVDLNKVASRYGARAAGALEAAARRISSEGGRSLLTLSHPGGYLDERQGTLRLTDPEGFLLSNQVIGILFAALEDGAERS